MDDLPLLELFTRLREAGVPLGISDYEAAVRAVQKGYGLPDRAALARLCQTLWVRSPDEQRLLDYYFEQIIGSANVSQADQVENETATHTPQQRKKRLIALYAGLASIAIFAVGVVLSYNRQPKAVQPLPSQSLAPTKLPSVSVTPKPSPSPIPPAPSSQNRFPNEFVWALLLLLALGTRAFWYFQAWIKRRHKDREQPAKPTQSDNRAKLTSDLLRETHDAVQVAQAVQQITNQRTDRSRVRFVFSGDYLPVTQRQMKQSWRYLRRMVREGVATELDIERTIQQIAREGMLLHPVLMPERTNRTELVLLIDQDGSMVPFHSLSARLVETALRGGRLGKTGAYYFHNCPVRYLYCDPMHQEGEPIEDVLKGFRRDLTSVLIFSDAGAARGGLSWERAELTATFLRQLKEHVRYIAWLNPMPQSRWETSTAREIALQVPMFEATRQGLDDAISVLRGRYQLSAEVLGGKK